MPPDSPRATLVDAFCDAAKNAGWDGNDISDFQSELSEDLAARGLNPIQQLLHPIKSVKVERRVILRYIKGGELEEWGAVTRERRWREIIDRLDFQRERPARSEREEEAAFEEWKKRRRRSGGEKSSPPEEVSDAQDYFGHRFRDGVCRYCGTQDSGPMSWEESCPSPAGPPRTGDAAVPEWTHKGYCSVCGEWQYWGGPEPGHCGAPLKLVSPR